MDYFYYERLEYNGFVNFMKVGIIVVDYVIIVSFIYRNEILMLYYGE